MDVSVDVTATLRAGMSGHPPLVMGIQQGVLGQRKLGSSSYRGGRNRREQSADSV